LVIYYIREGGAYMRLNPLKAEFNPIYHLLTLLGAHHILHVSRIRVNVHEEEEEEDETIFTSDLFFFDQLADIGSKLLQNTGKNYQRTCCVAKSYKHFEE
jgi:hypothetical protein